MKANFPHPNRRKVLQVLSSFAAMATMQIEDALAWTHGTVGTASTGHKAQVNLTYANPQSYGQDYPFIDMAKTLSNWSLASGGGAIDPFSYLGPNGIPTSVPAGASNWRSQLRCYLVASNPSTGNYVIDWDGAANISIGDGGGAGQPGTRANVVSSTANSINLNVVGVNSADVTFTGSFAPSGGNTVVTITGATNGTVWPGQRLGGAGLPAGLVLGNETGSTTQGNNGTYNVTNLTNDLVPFTAASTALTLYAYAPGDQVALYVVINSVTTTPTKIRLYRADQAALLNGGQITAPHFISYYGKYGCLRFMDWQTTNGSLSAQWGNRSQKSNFSWLGNGVMNYCGASSKAASTNDFTTATTISGSPTVWTDGMMVQARLPSIPSFTPISNIAVNATTGLVTITSTGHGLTTNQHVSLPLGDPISSGAGVAIQTAFNSTASGIPIAQDFTVTAVDANNVTLNGVDGRSWAAYTGTGYPGYIGPYFRFGTSTLPLKRVLGAGGQNIYYSQYVAVLNGTNYSGVGSPYMFVYNAAMDALLFALSPADDNGQLLGAPMEVIAQVSNECGVHPWVCLPELATDDYVLQAATYLKANLSGSLRARIEISNELWNGQFIGWNLTSILAGIQLGIVNSTNDYQLNSNVAGASAQWIGWRFYNAMAQVNSAYSGAMGQVYRVLAINGNSPNTTYTTQIFEAPNAGLGSAKPYQRADAFAIAPYFEVNRNIYPTAQAVYQFKIGDTTDAFAAADTWFQSSGNGVLSVKDWSDTVAPFFAARATQYGLEMHQYEGGWGVYPKVDYDTQGGPTSYDPGTGSVALTLTDATNFWRGYKASSNWGTLYASALATYVANGGKFASNYWINSSYWNMNNMFGSYGPNIFGTPTPPYISSQPTPEKTAFDAYNAS